MYIHTLGSYSYFSSTEVLPSVTGYIIVYSGTPLNGHPSTADTHDITDNSEVPTILPFTSVLKQLLNTGYPTTPYNGQLSRFQLYANNT